MTQIPVAPDPTAASSPDAARPGPAQPRPAGERDDPVRGILLMVAAGFLFSCSDAISKGLSATLPAIEIAWLRWLGFLVVVTPTIVASRGSVLRSRSPLTQTIRALGMVGSSAMFIAALHALPIATATTIGFVSPVVVTALSIVFLKEQVGLRRWAAVGTGLVGVVVVVRPGTSGFDVASIYPLVGAISWAIGVIATRKLAGIDRPWTAMTYTAIVGLAVLSLLVVDVWVTPNWTQFGLASVMAACATAAQFLILHSFRQASASLLAPFAYVQLIWSTAFGFVLFANLPDLWTWIGAGIIIASGMYTAHRERIRAREARFAKRA